MAVGRPVACSGRWRPSPHRSPRRSPPTCSRASCATSASTPSPRASASGARARRGSSTSARCSSRSCCAIGLDDAALDDNGYVTATLRRGDGPDAIGLIAHMDTSPDAPGAGVEPIVHRAYDGGVIELPRGGTVLDPAAMPRSPTRVGHDIVTS